MRHPFDVLKPEYELLLATMVVTRPQAIDRAARAVLANVPAHYAPVAKKTGVPAAVLGPINLRESDQDFRTGIGQGDPWNRVSTHVPRGCGPFTSWEAAAIFYVHFDHLDDASVPWSYAYACWKFEIWNGFGYRSHGVHSPYLFGGTNHQQPGKYVADGIWSSSAVDVQLGTVPVMLRMIELDPSLAFSGGIVPVESPPLVPGPVPDGVGGNLKGTAWIQNALNRLINAGLQVDDNYGRRTRDAVRIFQAAHGLEPDGMAGPKTCAMIDVELAKAANTKVA